MRVEIGRGFGFCGVGIGGRRRCVQKYREREFPFPSLELELKDQTVKPTQKLHKIKENVATLVGIFFGFPFSKLK